MLRQLHVLLGLLALAAGHLHAQPVPNLVVADHSAASGSGRAVIAALGGSTTALVPATAEGIVRGLSALPARPDAPLVVYVRAPGFVVQRPDGTDEGWLFATTPEFGGLSLRRLARVALGVPAREHWLLLDAETGGLPEGIGALLFHGRDGALARLLPTAAASDKSLAELLAATLAAAPPDTPAALRMPSGALSARAPGTARLDLSGWPPDAPVEVNGSRVAPTRVSAGEVRVLVTPPGVTPWVGAFFLKPGETRRAAPSFVSASTVVQIPPAWQRHRITVDGAPVAAAADSLQVPNGQHVVTVDTPGGTLSAALRFDGRPRRLDVRRVLQPERASLAILAPAWTQWRDGAWGKAVGWNVALAAPLVYAGLQNRSFQQAARQQQAAQSRYDAAQDEADVVAARTDVLAAYGRAQRYARARSRGWAVALGVHFASAIDGLLFHAAVPRLVLGPAEAPRVQLSATGLQVRLDAGRR